MTQPLDAQYWNTRYTSNETGWDIGHASTPIVEYINQLTDKSISILIPGCGNAYEAVYLLEQGFEHITLLDIAPVVIKELREKLKNYDRKRLRIVQEDFFTHDATYDLIIEQTFFCALEPSLRKDYALSMYELLNPGGRLVGVLFNRDFPGGPPFGGSLAEYESLFSPVFEVDTLAPCHNSIKPREGTEVFINFKRPEETEDDD
jgi:methyl halide transferase